MSQRRHRRSLVPLVLGTAVVLTAALFSSPAGAVGEPSVRMFVSTHTVTAERGRRDVVSVDPNAYVTPVGADFKLIVNRPDYDTPVTAKQVDPETDAVLRTFSEDTLDGWSGLKDFTQYEVRDPSGDVVSSGSSTFCPNSYGPERLNVDGNDGPPVPTYPYGCDSSSPFTRGSVWGIDLGWATPMLGGGGYYYYGGGRVRWKALKNRYTIHIEIAPAWVDALSIPPEDASADVKVRIVDSAPASAQAKKAVSAPADEPFSSTPIVTEPPPETLPDLVALPSWSMYIDKKRGHDYLSFSATEWNAGPGALVIDGFRTGDEPVMDAYQYFQGTDGDPVGRALIDQLHYHAGRHNHWHFDQFTQYSLLDVSKTLLDVSDKQSWCLGATDAIDLSVANANWNQFPEDIYTSCGLHQPGALWIREALPVGWGDTYGQGVNFGAFDITHVPNGTYYIRTQVNPTGSILEASSDNNIQDRLIKLRGKPGDRRVIVPPWHGIDTEGGYCYYCG